MINYPKTLSISELHEVDTLCMSKEICNRYNSHEVLCDEIERLQFEKSLETRQKIGFMIFSILGALTSLILILVNHVN